MSTIQLTKNARAIKMLSDLRDFLRKWGCKISTYDGEALLECKDGNITIPTDRYCEINAELIDEYVEQYYCDLAKEYEEVKSILEVEK